MYAEESINNQVSNIKIFRQSILQEAVQGKLVPQDPNDEPANELLKRIKDEKDELIADKKIKKEKPLPVDNEQKSPFLLPDLLPESWTQCYMVELCILITDGSDFKSSIASSSVNSNKFLSFDTERVNFPHRM